MKLRISVILKDWRRNQRALHQDVTATSKYRNLIATTKAFRPRFGTVPCRAPCHGVTPCQELPLNGKTHIIGLVASTLSLCEHLHPLSPIDPHHCCVILCKPCCLSREYIICYVHLLRFIDWPLEAFWETFFLGGRGIFGCSYVFGLSEIHLCLKIHKVF